jgi:hypothetical protein
MTASQPEQPLNVGDYLNPNTGRFWSMDSYEGTSQDPFSLHKYMYCHDDSINNSDPSGNDIHHKVPQSLWKGFSGEAISFFKSVAAVVDTGGNAHNFARHGAYNERANQLILEWLQQNSGVTKNNMSVDQAKKLLTFLEKDSFISGFNVAVKGGPATVASWFDKSGIKLLPEDLQARAIRGASGIRRSGLLAALAKRGTGPFLALGFTVVTAQRMHAQGYSDAEIKKEVANDLCWGIPGLAEKGTDAAWGEAVSIASQVRTGAFSYLDYDPENSKFDGSNGLLISDEAVRSVLNRGGSQITAGSLISVW